MAYRDHEEALRQKRDELTKDWKKIASEIAADDAREARARSVEAELARDARKNPAALPLLDRVAVAAPCDASWDDMVGDEKVRFCGLCEKNVYDLSAMMRDEAEAFVRAAEGGACVRLARRADGRVVSGDCPVGVKKRRVRLAIAGAIGGSLMGCVALLGIAKARMAEGPTVTPRVMGQMVVDMPPPPGPDHGAEDEVRPRRDLPRGGVKHPPVEAPRGGAR